MKTLPLSPNDSPFEAFHGQAESLLLVFGHKSDFSPDCWPSSLYFEKITPPLANTIPPLSIYTHTFSRMSLVNLLLSFIINIIVYALM